jgi:hypothetical protein
MRALAWIVPSLSSAIRAFTLWMAWGWFIVPLGVVRIGYWHTYGLILTVGLMRSVSTQTIREAHAVKARGETAQEGFEHEVGAAVANICLSAILLGVAAGVHYWLMP